MNFINYIFPVIFILIGVISTILMITFYRKKNDAKLKYFYFFPWGIFFILYLINRFFISNIGIYFKGLIFVFIGFYIFTALYYIFSKYRPLLLIFQIAQIIILAYSYLIIFNKIPRYFW